jgi:hypothetical protein
MSRRGWIRRTFALVGCLGLISGLAAIVGVFPRAYAQSGTTETFTSTQIGLVGTTPTFVETGPWQMAYDADCQGDFGDAYFIVAIHGGAGSDIGPQAVGTTGGGIWDYSDAGTFSLTITSTCTDWSITVSPRTVPEFWTQAPGAATAIAAGANGSVWVAGTILGAYGYGLYRWIGTGWAPEPGQAVTVAVDPHGVPWIVDSLHDVYVGSV